jgi:hydroxymethylglutaryl-CoA reductase
MPNSIKKITNNNKNTGILSNGIADVKNNQANDIRILTKECPANIFANKRIPKLTARAIYETNSIKIINGVIINGVPVGNKIEK